MKNYKLICTNTKQYGILYQDSVFDLNTFEPIKCEKYSLLRPGKFKHFSKELDDDFIKLLKKNFPYTLINKTLVIHINWKQKFFIGKDIYSAYPIWVIKRLLKFIQNEIE